MIRKWIRRVLALAKGVANPTMPSENVKEMKFQRHQLHSMSDENVRAFAKKHELPYLNEFLQSVALAQQGFQERKVRNFQLDLITRGCFDVTCPFTGNVLTTGSSLLLNDKSTVFGFVGSSSLMVCIGDLSQGYPICGAIFPGLRIVTTLVASDWGFLDRHLDEMLEVQRKCGWLPGPAGRSLKIVTGDSNFAHHAWNQLSAFQELAERGQSPALELIVTQEPFGPIREIFPEIDFSEVAYVPDIGLHGLNHGGELLAPIGAIFIQAALVDRLMQVAERRASAACQEMSAGLDRCQGPVLWISVRSRNRTPTNQVALLASLAEAFLRAAENAMIIIDGFSVSDDFERSPSYHQNAARGIVSEDIAVAEQVKEKIGHELSQRMLVAIGLSISDTILLARHADLYFCHHGSVQHKIGWFTSAPGMVHANLAVLESYPAIWVSQQSEVATKPTYIPSSLLRGTEELSGNVSELNHLLHHENYELNAEGTVQLFMAFAREIGVVPSASGAQA
ncbi:hypothetical protein FNL56_20130 [Tardiphaga sp. vice304]|uniref:hypothetical protein n=1 Tax=Tardiphaga sp. vice304 TaxID=2592817 RepID=UPI00116501E6|nr:hypothetical protein [Tardiphaga sp. vice304]QDM28178.1 hypothetical protein FNL56_20130 [Tardiphaga sp. vice304]